ncbi:AtuA-related protein [Ottowia thiooxydans]|uniref:AtuA-like ferredoxin-fold domain-containing protein n=1 Tax=Ottowia thiooxydans TaxID=219182 RepID=A0ABV2Q4E0_9BURK
MGILVHELAHARAGDKGNTSNVAVFAYNGSGWEKLRQELTAERVESAFSHLGAGAVRRYEVESLKALNFVIPKVLAGGVTRSLRLDPHGKTLSALMLGIELSDQ